MKKIVMMVALQLAVATAAHAYTCMEIRNTAQQWGYSRPDSVGGDLSAGMEKFQREMRNRQQVAEKGDRERAARRISRMSPDQIDDDNYDPMATLGGNSKKARKQTALDRQVTYFQGLLDNSASRMRHICTPLMSLSGPVGYADKINGAIWEEAKQCYVRGEIDYTELFVGAKLAQIGISAKAAIEWGRESNKMVAIGAETRQSMNALISESFPGSNYNCQVQSGTLVDGNISETYSHGRLVSREIRTHEGLLEKYGVGDAGTVSISISDGYGGNGQSGFAILDLASPQKSYINDLKLNITGSENRTFQAAGIVASKNQLTEAATRLYHSKYASTKTLSEYLSRLLLSVSAREELYAQLKTLKPH